MLFLGLISPNFFRQIKTSWGQFHQRFTLAFFVQNFGAKKFQTQSTALEFLEAKFCMKNVRVKC